MIFDIIIKIGYKEAIIPHVDSVDLIQMLLTLYRLESTTPDDNVVITLRPVREENIDNGKATG